MSEELITLKALCLRQPWANLITTGQKTIETRKWSTNYRGEILLCTSRKPEIEPYGKAVAIATLYHIEKMIKEHEQAAMTKVYDRACSWFLKDIIPIEPIPIKGQLSLFDVQLKWSDINFL
jgi:hypothetical protein